MKTSILRNSRRLWIATAFALVIFPCSLPAEDFTDVQYQALDKLLGGNLSALQEDSDKSIDSVLDALNEAYEGGYAKDPRAEAVRRQLVDEAGSLKKDIGKMEADVTSSRPNDRDPATMIFLLSREQAMSFRIYRWVRNATEMADLAHASSGRRNATSGEFLSQLMQYHENLQDTLAIGIQKTAILLVK